MAMVVKNNMSAVRTLNTLNGNSSALQKSLQRVSSGMKINSAQDDASGYAISERMRVRIRSLDQANQNTQNDSSLMKTAEGAVGNTVEILRALKEKAINAANDSNTDEDRQTIQKEINQFIDQIDDNALVQFNGKYLIDGSKNNATHDTKTILLNQSLKSDTSMSSALTDLRNRAGDSLGIQDTDKYQVSWVVNGEMKFESGDVKALSNLGALLGIASDAQATATLSDGKIAEEKEIETDTTNTGYDISKDKTLEKAITVKGSAVGEETTADSSKSTNDLKAGAAQKLLSELGSILTDATDSDSTLTEDMLTSLADGGTIGIENYKVAPVATDATEAASATIFITADYAVRTSVGTDYANVKYTFEITAPTGYSSKTSVDLYKAKSNEAKDGPFEDAADKFGNAVYTPDETPGVALAANTAGVDKQLSGFTVSILDRDGNVKKAANAALDQFKQYQRAENQTGDMSLNFHIGSEANVAIKVGMGDMRSQALGLKGSDGKRIDVYTKDHANSAINVIENALTKALDQQTTIGAVEARLEYTSTNLTTSSENVQAAESTIRDADMAKEMTNYTKNNVLLQAAQAMLAQANQNSSAVLSLLQ